MTGGMNVGEKRAWAVRRVNSLLEQLPPEFHPAMSEAWDELLTPLEEMRESEAVVHIRAWVEEMELRLTPPLAHAPLGDREA